jgi:uncharacterized protein (TIGR02217 family)
VSVSFLDIYPPANVRGYPFTSSPRFSTTITGVSSGSEHRNRNWKHPLHRYLSPEAIRCHEDIEDIRDHWMVTGGPFLSFPLRDPMDFASRRLQKANLVPALYPTDQVLGTGDGATRDFQLAKTYTRGGASYTRPIYLPLVDSVLVAIDAKSTNTADPTLPGGPYLWDVSRQGGVVTFDHAPQAGQIITAGFLFDVPVRFEGDDSLDAILQAYQVSGVADLTLFEVRPCFIGEES